MNYQSNAPDKDVYAYYGDFNGDGIEDIAVWYDGAFRGIDLLDATGAAQKTFHFEEGVNIYHTYNQRAAAIRHEPNLIRSIEVMDGIEEVH